VPQDGRFKLRLGVRDIDFRISIIPSVFGEDVVVRILDKSSITEGLRGLRLESLGMSSDVLKKFRRAVREPYGMVLITGPTGSGKTTTLYAALSELDAGEEKVITIEDPVEYQLEGIVQIPVNEKKGLTFARGLRSVLRHDPDKIMVGEIRDAETAQIAVQSALTGHLVFTTVHANNAFDVIGRFAHMGVDVYGFVSALNCVMAQRLVRMICPRCRRETRADAELLELSGLDPNRYLGHKWVEGAGCEHCNGTGYRGRAAITELLNLSVRVRQMISTGVRPPISRRRRWKRGWLRCANRRSPRPLRARPRCGRSIVLRSWIERAQGRFAPAESAGLAIGRDYVGFAHLAAGGGGWRVQTLTEAKFDPPLFPGAPSPQAAAALTGALQTFPTT